MRDVSAATVDHVPPLRPHARVATDEFRAAANLYTHGQPSPGRNPGTGAPVRGITRSGVHLSVMATGQVIGHPGISYRSPG